MNINCVIVDDEALARKGLEQYVKKIEFLKLVGICKNAMQVNTLINEENIDLLFLDIEMPMISGIEFLKSLKSTPKVIFTTAYSEYAIDSFEFDVVDYLVKPISFERFLQASNKAYRQIAREKQKEQIVKEPEIKEEEDFIFIKADNRLVKVMLNDILYVESMQNYIRIITKSENLITLVPLKKIRELLPEKDFIQIHKSFIVAKSKVEAISGNQVVIGDHKIKIARTSRDATIKALTAEKILKK